MNWTHKHPDELGVWHEEPGHQPVYEQLHYPTFYGADLKNASFEDVKFSNADFRGADSLLTCNFSGASGLETCIFDDDSIHKAVIAASKLEK